MSTIKLYIIAILASFLTFWISVAYCVYRFATSDYREEFSQECAQQEGAYLQVGRLNACVVPVKNGYRFKF